MPGIEKITNISWQGYLKKPEAGIIKDKGKVWKGWGLLETSCKSAVKITSNCDEVDGGQASGGTCAAIILEFDAASGDPNIDAGAVCGLDTMTRGSECWSTLGELVAYKGFCAYSKSEGISMQAKTIGTLH